MRVYTFESSGPAAIPESELDVPSGPRIGWGVAVPTTGYWKVGDAFFVDGVLYICSAEGTPGSWVANAFTGATAPVTLAGVGDTTPLTINAIAGLTAYLADWQVGGVTKAYIAADGSMVVVSINSGEAYITNGYFSGLVSVAGRVLSAAEPVGRRVAVPATAAAAGTSGDWAAAAGWLYVCLSTGVWQRTALATW